jgi:hypothetical protein
MHNPLTNRQSMAHEPGRPLADAYAAWAAVLGLTVADVQRASGLMRHTIEDIRKARGRQTERVTLRQLAVGVATERGPGRYHESIMKQAYRDFLAAAGYGDPNVDDARSLMDLALYYRFRSPAKAHIWASLMDRLEALEPETLRVLFAPLGPDNQKSLSTE